MKPDRQNAVKATKERPHYTNLDILRLVLASTVLAAHTFSHWGSLEEVPLVGTFVCLSGYLIPASFTTSRSAGHFYWKRFLRVAPGFLVVMAFIGYIYGLFSVKETILYWAFAGLRHASTTKQGSLWSLVVEEWLYLFHGASHKLLRLWNIPAVTLCMIVCMTVKAIPGTFSSIGGVCAAFFAGNLLYMSGAAQKSKWILLPSAAVLILGILALINRIDWTLTSISCTAVPVSILLICLNLPHFPVRIIDISYGVYIYQGFFCPEVRRSWIGQQLGLGHTTEIGTFMLRLTVVILISLMSWFLVESRALKLRNWRPMFFKSRANGKNAFALENARSGM